MKILLGLNVLAVVFMALACPTAKGSVTAWNESYYVWGTYPSNLHQFNNSGGRPATMGPTTHSFSVDGISTILDASQGQLHLFNEVTAIHPEMGSANSVRSKAGVAFEDTITVSGFSGQGKLKGSIWIHAVLSTYSSDNFAVNNFFVAIGNSVVAFDSDGYIAKYLASPLTTTASPLVIDQALPFEIEFTYGQPFPFAVSMVSDLFTGSSSGSVDTSTHSAGNTVTWNGISEVMFRNTEGNYEPLESGYSITSGTGTNYEVSMVPEPESNALAMLGAAIATALMWRRRLAVHPE